MPDAVAPEAFPNPWAATVAGGVPARRGGEGGGRRGRDGGAGRGRRGRGETRGAAAATIPDFGGITQERRQLLTDSITGFHAAASTSATPEAAVISQLAGEFELPADLSPLERRFVYHTVEQLGGLVARGDGVGENRHIIISRDSAIQPSRMVCGLAARHTGDRNFASRSTVAQEREAELEDQVQALSEGREIGARVRVGDSVQLLSVLGPDRRHLEGRVGVVKGSLPLLSLSNAGGAYTVHFDGDGEMLGQGLDLTVEARDIRIFEAKRPLEEGSLSFPKTLNGFERKIVHTAAERFGLISQSFGEGQDRYITVFRAAEGQRTSGCNLSKQSEGSPSSKQEPANGSGGTTLQTTVVVLNGGSRAALLQAIGEFPQDWQVLGSHMMICDGPLVAPSTRDRRSIGSDILDRVAALRPGAEVELRVVSVARAARALAVGVLGVPAVTRNPHVIVAVAPGEGSSAGDRLEDWKPWSKAPLLLHGRIAELTRDEASASLVAAPSAA